MKSVLHGVTRANIESDPFPHVVVDDALDPELYAELAASFPPNDAFVRGGPLESNTPYFLNAERSLPDESISPRWREFVRRHTSSEFFDEVVTLFGPTIRLLHPRLSLDGVRTSVRRRAAGREDARRRADFALECQLVWGSPVAHPSRAHPVHVDRSCALYAGLLYMRHPDDDATGGDLELYRFRSAARAYNERRFVDDSLVERVKTIPYAPNRLVFFIHHAEALHAVSVRSATPHPRLHVNFVAETDRDIFSLERPLIDRDTAVIVCSGPSLESLSAAAWQEIQQAGAVVAVNGAPEAEAVKAHGVRFTMLAAMDFNQGLLNKVPTLAETWRTANAWRVTSVLCDAPAETYLREVDEEDGVEGWSDDPGEGYKGGSTAMIIGNWLGNDWADEERAPRHRRGFRRLAYVGLDMVPNDGRHARGAGAHHSGFASSLEQHRRVCGGWGKLCAQAAKRGIEIINLTPGTGLAEMKRVDVPEHWLTGLDEVVSA